MFKWIEDAWNRRELLNEKECREAVEEAIEGLDKGTQRIASRSEDGTWQVEESLKKAVLLYFQIKQMHKTESGPFEYFDKIPLKRGYESAGVRVLPGAVIRYGSFLERNVICMPSFINIGARVGEGTMVDTWATVGSCAQIGSHVHLSGGVGIGGVLEPVQAAPVIIEDGVFVGSRCIVVEGVIVRKEAVLGAGLVLTSSTRIIDVSGSEAIEWKGEIPERAVVIPGTVSKQFPAGEYQVPSALIIGKRKASTDQKTSLNETLREFQIAT